MLTDTLPAEKQIARAATQTRLGIIFRLLRNRFVATITIMRFHLRLLLAPFVLCAVALNAFSAEPLVVPLWPEGVPGLKTNAGQEVEFGGRFTNIHNPTITMYAPDVAKSTGVARFGEPEEIAALVAFLASAEAGYIQGAILDIDGGWNRAL